MSKFSFWLLVQYTNRDGTPLPMLIQKLDRGFNYATTYLAAINHRVLMAAEDGGKKASRVLYVTDLGQDGVQSGKACLLRSCGHVLGACPIWLVQGKDGKKFATYPGETMILKDLLNKSFHVLSHAI
jgi:arginyl-tRNA synthetase